ncbi:hypothetical protein KKG61_02400 [bacterium]|nr:hypothetical protein [bacterium]MBU2461534.1 hypothetical protein [bacterium]
MNRAITINKRNTERLNLPEIICPSITVAIIYSAVFRNVSARIFFSLFCESHLIFNLSLYLKFVKYIKQPTYEVDYRG